MKKFSYSSRNGTFTKLGTRILNGEGSIFISYWVNDSGYTFVTDKADYITFDYYLKKNGKTVKLDRPFFKSIDEHGSILRQLRRIYPKCSALEIDSKERKVTYEGIPELIQMANTSCGSKG